MDPPSNVILQRVNISPKSLEFRPSLPTWVDLKFSEWSTEEICHMTMDQMLTLIGQGVGMAGRSRAHLDRYADRIL